jgi:hypothetical protein
LLRKIFGKENRIIAFQDPTNWIYDYHEMGVRFDVNYIPSFNKKCARGTKLDSDYFNKMNK